MSSDVFLERLRRHSDTARAAPPRQPGHDPPETGASDRPAVLTQSDQLAFWQSGVARSAINRRITGEPDIGPDIYLARRHGPSIVVPHAASLRATDPRLEVALVEIGACQDVVVIDRDEKRSAFAKGRIPEPVRDRVRFEGADLGDWTPARKLGAVVARSVLHRESDLERVLDWIGSLLAPGGLIFVDEFIGPARFQWRDSQLELINRLLARLPDELLVDLSASDGRVKRSVERSPADAVARANPTDAVRSDEIVPLLDERFERVEIFLHGGALYHQLFSRIMGNFATRPELVSIVMELDAILTDSGVLESDYVWGVWRRP